MREDEEDDMFRTDSPEQNEVTSRENVQDTLPNPSEQPTNVTAEHITAQLEGSDEHPLLGSPSLRNRPINDDETSPIFLSRSQRRGAAIRRIEVDRQAGVVSAPSSLPALPDISALSDDDVDSPTENPPQSFSAPLPLANPPAAEPSSLYRTLSTGPLESSAAGPLASSVPSTIVGGPSTISAADHSEGSSGGPSANHSEGSSASSGAGPSTVSSAGPSTSSSTAASTSSSVVPSAGSSAAPESSSASSSAGPSASLIARPSSPLSNISVPEPANAAATESAAVTAGSLDEEDGAARLGGGGFIPAGVSPYFAFNEPSPIPATVSSNRRR